MENKTLKDLETDGGYMRATIVHSKDLKEQVIKWVKERIRKCCGVEGILKICEEHLFWMDKFNITEEDLK